MMRFLSACMISLLLCTPAAYAAFEGPGSTQAVTTAARARELPNETKIVLEGHLIEKKSRKERYTFRDQSGIITVEIDDKLFLSLPTITPETTVRLHGEVDTSAFEPTEIEVERMEIIQ
ncbi:MAG: NirD/YgiW/YdeI family stress tolerance protein [Desulfovibrionaceae bacterium]|nr:NirD/YgiW/YdeI family stress tolerance protein [Desulfovibrionaceae bacterium]